MKKSIYYLSIMTILAALGLSIYAIYSLFYPFKVLVVNGPVKILTPVVKVNEEVVYEVDLCKYSDIPGVLSRQVVDTAILSMPDMGVTLGRGCRKVQASLPLPKFLPPNTYHINFVARYKINALRTITVSYQSEEFKIIK